MNTQKIENLKETLSNVSSVTGRELTFKLEDGFVIVENKEVEDYPVFLTVCDQTISCWTNIVSYKDVKDDDIGKLSYALLRANSISGLSKFKADEVGFSLVGELSMSSTPEQVLEEIEALFSTTVESLELFLEYVE